MTTGAKISVVVVVAVVLIVVLLLLFYYVIPDGNGLTGKERSGTGTSYRNANKPPKNGVNVAAILAGVGALIQSLSKAFLGVISKEKPKGKYDKLDKPIDMQFLDALNLNSSVGAYEGGVDYSNLYSDSNYTPGAYSYQTEQTGTTISQDVPIG